MATDYQSTYQRYRKAIDNSERSRDQIADMCAQYMTLYRSLCHIHRLAKEGAILRLETFKTEVNVSTSEANRDLAKRIRQENRAQAQERAKKRHAEDPKQADKAQVKDCWKRWQRKPSNYQSKAAFARDMLSKYDRLISQKKIEDWCRQWENDARLRIFNALLKP